MRGKKEKEIFIYYIKERYVLLAAYIFIVLTFLAVAALYGYDNSVIHMLYAAVLIIFFSFWVGAADYVRYRNKCLKLYEALLKRGESDYHLPAAGTLAEELYGKMVLAAKEDERKLISELDEKRRDMTDYYTMWIHQIKTPIAALQLLQKRMSDMDDLKRTSGEEAEADREEESRTDPILKQASEELFKIERYAEMALYYARLDNMSSDMLFQEYDVSVIIKRAIKKYSILFIGSRLSFSLEEFECRAVTDEKWLTFAIEQILSNALKYTAKGGILIYGADENGMRCGGNVNHVVIEDTGIGICESDLPRIFERGFTGYNGRMGRKSTGIGLYLCKQIMDKLSHKIEVRSAENEGTKVILGFERENYNVTKM